MRLYPRLCIFFFFNDTATTEIYTLSLHDALPILAMHKLVGLRCQMLIGLNSGRIGHLGKQRSEEHTSELQSHSDLVCRLLLEKKKNRVFQLNSQCVNHVITQVTSLYY